MTFAVNVLMKTKSLFYLFIAIICSVAGVCMVVWYTDNSYEYIDMAIAAALPCSVSMASKRLLEWLLLVFWVMFVVAIYVENRPLIFIGTMGMLVFTGALAWRRSLGLATTTGKPVPQSVDVDVSRN